VARHGAAVLSSDQTRSVDDVLALLRENGGRVTSARRIVVESLFGSPGHLTAEDLAAEVQDRAPDVHLSTIYRTLEDLEGLGVVVHSHFGHGPSTFHLASRAHGHLVCEECGECIEVPEAAFRSLMLAMRSRYDFEINAGHSAVLGRCSSCR
jgi:Fur family transcriptional regulator, ferric uptake regulator